MDHDAFDRIARVLGGATSRRAGLGAALGGLLGLGITAATDVEAARGHAGADAKRRKRRKKCHPPCAAGQTCVTGTCRCDNGGTVCGANCCLIGQSCEGGACVAGPNPTCIPAGEPCKGTGRPCCDGRTCASGQGGMDDVACYVHKTGACATTDDCVYGTVCAGGRCGLDTPAGLTEPCSPVNQAACVTPGAVCAPYESGAAPEGYHCTLPLNYACTGDPECTCHHCGWVAADQVQGAAGRAARAASGLPRLACCGPEGFACRSDRNCCLGSACVGGACAACQLEAGHLFNVPLPPPPEPVAYPITRVISMAFLPDGRMLVAGCDSGFNRWAVLVYARTNGTWTYTGQTFGDTLVGIGGLSIGPDDAVYITDNGLGLTVWRETDGVWVQDPYETFSLLGGTEMAWMPDGRLLVADAANGGVEIFRKVSGGWERTGTIPDPQPNSGTTGGVAIALDGDVSYSYYYNGNPVYVRSYRETNGAWTEVETFGAGWGSALDQFAGPYGLSWLGPWLLVTNIWDGQVSVWSAGPDGAMTAQLKFGAQGTGEADLIEPTIAIPGPDGLVYVSDGLNGRVSVWGLGCAAG